MDNEKEIAQSDVTGKYQRTFQPLEYDFQMDTDTCDCNDGGYSSCCDECDCEDGDYCSCCDENKVNDNVSADDIASDMNELLIYMSDGSSYAIDVDDLEWDSLINSIPQAEDNVKTLRNMLLDVIAMPTTCRDTEIPVIQEKLNNFADCLGIKFEYEKINSAITNYEKCIFSCNDMINAMETVIHYAKMKDMSQTVESIFKLFSVGNDSCDSVKRANVNDEADMETSTDRKIQDLINSECYECGVFDDDSVND